MRPALSLLFLLTPAMLAQAPQTPPTLRIPAFCGYAHPDPEAVRRNNDTGAVRECRGELRYYVEVTTPGELQIEIERRDGAPKATIEVLLSPHSQNRQSSVISQSSVTSELPADAARHLIGTLALVAAGMQCITVKSPDGSPLRELLALHLSGPAAAAAKTLTVERRNAASVHLAYEAPVQHRADIEWFACELEPKTDPLWTYYMATGWHRGYFGMQVNSATERRLIFSVWDSGNEAIDRNKVGADDRVQLVRKGDQVIAEGFGHEGTGGHSHLVHDWQLGDRVRFLVHAEPDADHTTYTGWYQHLRAGKPLGGDGWQLLASFRAPKDGKYLHGLYSFSENFSGANGDVLRECEYGEVWLRTHAGEWLPVRTAKFTHDGHGKEHRLDRAGGVNGQRFFLRHGDFVTAGMPYGSRVELPAATGPSQPPPLLPQ